MSDQDKINELIEIEAALQQLLTRSSRLRVQLQVNEGNKKKKLTKTVDQKYLNNLHKTIRKRNVVVD